MNQKPEDRKLCPYCGEDNFYFAKYCSGCGYEIPKKAVSKCVEKNVAIPDDKKTTTSKISCKDFHSNKIKIDNNYKSWILEFLCALILILTNPNKQMHIEYVKDKIYESSYNENNQSSDYLGVIELIFGKERTDFIISHFVERKNFILFSITSVKFNNNKNVIAVGILGTFINLKEFNKGLEELLNNN